MKPSTSLLANLRFEESDAAGEYAQSLMQALDAEIARTFPGVWLGGLDADAFAQGGGRFYLAFLGAELVACGATQPLTPQVCEIKRVYVAAPYRGRGIARALFMHLVALAEREGFRELWLATGKGQTEAIALYRSCGFEDIPRYGDYVDDSNCVALGKVLRA